MGWIKEVPTLCALSLEEKRPALFRVRCTSSDLADWG
jgi:hypothetical protein